ncbi:SDR family oxidoreductase [Pontitalea aquivivens]|uniref:SDR family oxidoreductase n=1 Tax=Pontitalea aquivivens TaxID=3388663 RepID=UPI0039706035
MQRVQPGRLGDPDEIAAPIVFLASDRGTLITGSVLGADGGYLAVGAPKYAM